jgi:hypothetical protein
MREARLQKNFTPRLRLVKKPKLLHMPGHYVGGCGAVHCATCWHIDRSGARFKLQPSCN